MGGCRLSSDGTEWTLLVENANGTSIVWDAPSPPTMPPMPSFLRTVKEEGMKVFLDDAPLIPSLGTEAHSVFLPSVSRHDTNHP